MDCQQDYGVNKLKRKTAIHAGKTTITDIYIVVGTAECTILKKIHKKNKNKNVSLDKHFLLCWVKFYGYK